MANRAELQNRLIQFFRDKLEIDVPSPETDLIDTGLMDSLVFVELLFQLEREWGVTISMDILDLDQFRSIASIVSFIDQPEPVKG
jgi:acyl carrier protein